MGIYDQFLDLTQRGLDTGQQIAMQRAQQPTMADVFMQRFRQGGQDQLARQKMDQQRMMDEAALRHQSNQEQLQAMTGASNLATDATAPAWESMQRNVGVQTPVSGPGLKQRSLESTIEQLLARLDAQRGIASQNNDTKRYAVDVNANKPQIELEKINRALNRGGITPDQAKLAEAKATHINETPVYNTPQAAVDAATGQPVLIQPKKTGGVERVEGYEPAAKSGSRKPVDPAKVNKILDEIEKVIPYTSGSAVGALTSQVKGLLGKSDATTQANTKILAAGASLMMNMPRMEGPQSDKDVALYREQTGKLNDPKTPIGDKKAAVQIIRALNQQYASQNQQQGAPKAGGEKVVDFNDFMK